MGLTSTAHNGLALLERTFLKGMTMRHPFVTALLASLLCCSLAWAQAAGQSETAKDSPQVTTQESPQAIPPEPLQRVLQSVVTVQSRSDAQASTSRTLGQRREGSGVVIGPDLVLTIGYLLLEAESVDLIDRLGRRIPGQVRAVDNLTGLGLIRTLIPLRLDAVPLGNSDTLPTPSKLWTLGQKETAPTALELVSRKVFAGSWEYLLETPLMTLPAVNNWSGSGLFDAQGQLVGIGSLLVQDVYGDQVPLPGNLFVPVNLLKDPLPDLVHTGKRTGPATPWLGISSQRLPSGGLGVLRVSPNSPAAQAGIAVGDTLLALQGQTLQDLPDFYRRLRALGPAGSRLTLTVRSEGQSREVELRSTDRAAALKRPSGI
jgi:S1-C subfamily serine protease